MAAPRELMRFNQDGFAKLRRRALPAQAWKGRRRMDGAASGFTCVTQRVFRSPTGLGRHNGQRTTVIAPGAARTCTC